LNPLLKERAEGGVGLPRFRCIKVLAGKQSKKGELPRNNNNKNKNNNQRKNSS